MKKIIPFILLLALSACTSIPNPFKDFSNPLTRTTLVEVENGYGAALAIAVGYRNACANRAIPPSCRPVVKQLQAAGAKAQGAVVAARKFVKNYPTLDATQAIGAAQAAVADFKAEQTRLGVK